MNSFLNASGRLLKYFFVLLGMFMFMRLLFLFRFGNAKLASTYGSDLLRAFKVGALFDIQTILYGLTPLVLMYLFSGLFAKKKREKLFQGFTRGYLLSVTAIYALILLCDQQFYSFFQNHLNVLAFGLVEDDTMAVITSMWTDHPVIRMCVAMVFIVYVSRKMLISIFEAKKQERIYSTPAKIFLPLLLIGGIVLGLRGSIGTFPLQIDSASVSENAFVNKVPLHGVYTLIKAFGKKDNVRTKQQPEELLKKAGFGSLREAYAVRWQLPADSVPGDSVDFFFRKTKKNTFLEKNPPHVVFFMMEGMGRHYLTFDSEKLNLTGALRKHLKEDFVFYNFLPAHNGTINSLEALAFNVLEPPITATPQRFKTYKSSVAYPFKQAGYSTHFISGGHITWRNLHQMLPLNYFDESYGKSGVLKNVKNAEAGATWGVYDEYLFEDALQKLREAKEPQFIFAQSMTNHTPYELPDHYRTLPLELNDEIRPLFSKSDDEVIKCFEAYQYANHQLGVFMDKLKDSPMAKNTIVVATGDHNIRNLVNYDLLNDQMSKRSVPMYIYIPKAYQQGITVNTERYGSHKDIFPTIFNLSLSEQKYFQAGNDLFASDTGQIFYAKNIAHRVQADSVDMEKSLRVQQAEEALTKYYFNENY